MIQKLLIANRGECACRIARTAKRLGVRTVAVYSDADTGALHTRLADEALPIGPATANDSYLSIEKIVDAAVRSGADALHPGYGFLAEEPALAEACKARGLLFVGPPPSAMRAMASKDNAKRLAEAAGVPVLPWAPVPADPALPVLDLGDEIGFPLLVKATAGGGGRGMRVVRNPGELAGAVAEAQSEAHRAFGNGDLFVERFLPNARHVEVQVFADRHGNVVHLFDRECSVQRRYQKIVEEAPATRLSGATRTAMREAAMRLTSAISYEGAGTVEFVVDSSDEDGSFFFLEMNTRLQVEHPVTELTTGLDLVEWQLRVAAGEQLPLGQSAIRSKGHAIEARLYAEDPAQGFMPSPGRIGVLEVPDELVRSDMGYESGDTVPEAYDPMIGKLVAYGADRRTALATLDEALGMSRVGGVQTNARFLAAIARDPSFIGGAYDTGLIEQLLPGLAEDLRDRVPRDALILAALHELEARMSRPATRSIHETADHFSPWDVRDGWLLNLPAVALLRFVDGSGTVEIAAHPHGKGAYRLRLSDTVVETRAEVSGADVRASVDDIEILGRVIEEDGVLRVSLGDRDYELRDYAATLATGTPGAAQGDIVSAIPGTVLEVLVHEGDTVEEGDALVVLESMKMVYTIRASGRCTIREVAVERLQQVPKGTKLIKVSED